MSGGMDWSGVATFVVAAIAFGVFYWQAKRKAKAQAAAAPPPGPVIAPDQPSPAFAASLSDPDLPHELRARGWRLYLGAGVMGVGVVVLLAIAVLTLTERDVQFLALLLVGLAFLLMWSIWRLRTPSMVLYPDRLEYRRLNGPQVLARRDLLGVRAAGSDRGGAWIELVPVAGAGKPIRIRERLRDNDPVALRWFAGARDLTAEILAAARATILADPRYGTSPRERETRLKAAGVVVVGFSVVCLGLGAWLFFAPPQPLWTGLLVAALALAVGAVLVWASDGLVVWIAKPARPTAVAALVPALAVALWGLLRVHLIAPQPLWIAAAVCAVAVAGLVYATSTNARRLGQAIGFAVGAGLLGYGLPAAADRVLDDSVTSPVPVTVTDRREDRGSRSTSYYVTVSPTLPDQDSDIEVSSEFYDAVQVGQTLCLSPHPGALKIRWFDIGDCPAGTIAQQPAGQS
jgi:hypothetical protein